MDQNNIRILVVGCGRMGIAHASAYHALDGFEVVGVVNRSPEPRAKLAQALSDVPQFADYYDALAQTQPDAVSINTYTETHAPYAIAALENGAHVFVEKPLAETVDEAQTVIDVANKHNKKLMIGYILRHHPSWQQFINVAKTLGKPLVMRLNLNQQCSGENWNRHLKLMNSCSPIVDCGVHYIDVMCQMTQAKPMQVHAVGARLTEELDPNMYNYGKLHVVFDDQSVGWYEAGWGPMMSEVAFFVKDVIGPKGHVNICDAQARGAKSQDINAHTRTQQMTVHYSELDANNCFANDKQVIDLDDEPDHDALCRLEQEFFLRAIQDDVDLTRHHQDTVRSMQVVLAADQSIRMGEVVHL